MPGTRPGMTADGGSSHAHLDYLRGVVAEDVDHLHRDLVFPLRRILMRRAFQFQLAIAARPEALPLVLENVAPGAMRPVASGKVTTIVSGRRVKSKSTAQ